MGRVKFPHCQRGPSKLLIGDPWSMPYPRPFDRYSIKYGDRWRNILNGTGPRRHGDLPCGFDEKISHVWPFSTVYDRALSDVLFARQVWSCMISAERLSHIRFSTGRTFRLKRLFSNEFKTYSYVGYIRASRKSNLHVVTALRFWWDLNRVPVAETEHSPAGAAQRPQITSNTLTIVTAAAAAAKPNTILWPIPGPAQGRSELGTCLERHFSKGGIFKTAT